MRLRMVALAALLLPVAAADRSDVAVAGTLRTDHVLAIDLSYSLQRLLDRHGNQLRYRTEIRFVDGRVGTAYDVIFVPAP